MSIEAPQTPFELLVSYLHGKPNVLNDLTRVLEPQCTPDKNALDLYKNTVFTPEQEQILRAEFRVPAKASIESADNLLELINHLNKAGYGHGQLADFKYQLKQIYKMPDWSGTLLSATYLAGAWLAGVVSSFFFLNQKQLERIEGALVRTLPFIPPILLVGFQFYTIRQAYRTHDEDTHYSPNHRRQRWFVNALPPMLTLSAYVAIAIAGSMSPLAITLFVSASLVTVVDGALRFYHLKTTPEQTESNTVSAIREENHKTRTAQTIMVKLCTALALSATVSISCILPFTTLLMLSCAAVFISIALTKSFLLNKIHTDSSAQLLTDINAYKLDHKDEHQNKHQDQPTASHVTRVATALEQDAQPSRMGIFKSIATQTNQKDLKEELNNALEASLVSSHP